MTKTLKLAHFVGLVLVLGSIVTYIVISALIKGASLEALVFGRTVIRTGTLYVTMPGMWLITLTGIALAARKYAFFTLRWLDLKLVLAGAALVNAHLVIVPATGKLLELAQASLAAGALHADYASLYLFRESLPGAANVAAMLAAMALAIWRPAGKEKATPVLQGASEQRGA